MTGGATTFGAHRNVSRIGDKIGQTPPSFSHHEISPMRYIVTTAQSLLDNYRSNGGSPLDKPNQFLLQVALPPCSFQILNAPEVIHDVLRLAEVNLRTEIQNAIRSEGIKSKRKPYASVKGSVGLIAPRSQHRGRRSKPDESGERGKNLFMGRTSSLPRSVFHHF